MEPISLAIGAIGLGMQIFGAFGQANNSREITQASEDESRQEQGINNAKNRQMHIEARRMQLENVRNNQRARALATNSAVSQGAQNGSGLAGGLAQINDQSLFNMQGVNQAEDIGNQILGFNNAISRDKARIASLQGSSATDAGIASLGGAVMKAGPIIGQLSQGFGGGGTTGGMGMRLNGTGSLY
jgi:hypothetical protein